MRMSTSVIRILVVLGVFAFFSPSFSITLKPENEKAQHSISDDEDTVALLASKWTGILSSFGVRIAGTYLVARQPDDGPTRILNLFADGNLTSMQSIQFGGEAIKGDWFSNQNGTWKRIGEHEIEATVLNLAYEPLTGEFLGTTIAHYRLQFDNTFQIVTGRVDGKIFSPGVDPLSPDESQPIAEFSDDFQARRVTVSN